MGQIQFRLLNSIVNRCDYSQKEVWDKCEDTTLGQYFTMYELTEDRAKLLHASLMCYWCLIVVIMNLFSGIVTSTRITFTTDVFSHRFFLLSSWSLQMIQRRKKRKK